MLGALREHWGNPSSVHRLGQDARAQIELARESLANLVGARARDLVLTSGGTEAIDLAIRGVLDARSKPGAAPPEIVSVKVEHAAVRDLVDDLETRGAARATWARVTRDGAVEIDSLRECVGPATALVVVQWANNETGTIQPVAEIARLCRERRVPFLCDGVQWVGKLPARVGGPAGDLGSIDCDLLAFSAHKFHGPKGVGALWVRPGMSLRPRLRGTQELGRRGGTENVPGIVGAGVAAAEATRWLADASERARVGSLRDLFEQRVLGRVPDAKVNGPVDAPGTPEPRLRRLWNTSNLAFPRLEAEALLLRLSERGVCASAGAACSSGSLDPSPVLLAMGTPEADAHGSLRFSLSRDTTQAEVAQAAESVAEAVGVLRASMP